MAWRDARVEERFGLTDYPRLDETEITLLHHLDWWDGPLNGVIAYRGDVFWFDFYHFDRDTSPYASLDPEDRHYFYLAFPLAPQENDECERRFTELEDLRRRYLAAREKEQQKATGAEPGWRWTGPDLGDRTPIGWFTDGANGAFYPIEITHATPKPAEP
jgi:hypothetical protein